MNNFLLLSVTKELFDLLVIITLIHLSFQKIFLYKNRLSLKLFNFFNINFFFSNKKLNKFKFFILILYNII